MSKSACAELERFRREAALALHEARSIRLSRDVSIQEDARLNREGYQRVEAMVAHLLTGHDGKPCPAGDRPIVRTPARRAVA
jgi:hypothetical protein